MTAGGTRPGTRLVVTYGAAIAAAEAVVEWHPRTGVLVYAALLWTALNHALAAGGWTSPAGGVALRLTPTVVLVAVLAVAATPGLDTGKGRAEAAAPSPTTTAPVVTTSPAPTTTRSPTTTAPPKATSPATAILPEAPAESYGLEIVGCRQVAGTGPVEYRGSITNRAGAALVFEALVVLEREGAVAGSVLLTTPVLAPGGVAPLEAAFDTTEDLRNTDAVCRVTRVGSRGSTAPAAEGLAEAAPETYELGISRCRQATSGAPVEYGGSITNRGGTTVVFEITVQLKRDDEVVGSALVTTPPVAPGETAPLDATLATADDLRNTGAVCRVGRVASRAP